MNAHPIHCRTALSALLVVAALAACHDDDDSGTPDTGNHDDVTRSDTGVETGEDRDCTFGPDPSFADGEEADMAGMTAAHNRWRVRVGVERVAWNTTLAASAKAYAAQCVWEHSDDRSPDAGFDAVGENLAYTTQQLSAYGVEGATNMWARERLDWDLGMKVGDGNFSDYGHYTQLVWRSTAEIGCGAAFCANVDGIGNPGTVIVCRYGPAGNSTGGAPYQESSGACLDLDNDDVRQRDDADDTDRTVH